MGRSTPSGEFGIFVSPTRNIYCTADAADLLVGCELGSAGIVDPTACSGAQVDGVGRLEITDDGSARPVCNSDTIRTVPVQNLEALPYGSSVRSDKGPVTCAIEQTGVTCLDSATNVGFFLNRSEYRVLR